MPTPSSCPRAAEAKALFEQIASRMPNAREQVRYLCDAEAVAILIPQVIAQQAGTQLSLQQLADWLVPGADAVTDCPPALWRVLPYLTGACGVLDLEFTYHGAPVHKITHQAGVPCAWDANGQELPADEVVLGFVRRRLPEEGGA